MAGWLGPALKAVLPHLGTVVSAVAPAFTRKREEAAANQMQLLQEQIAELQTAATQNVEYIKEVATQLQSTVTGLEQLAAIAEAKNHWSLRLSIAALLFSSIGISLALFIIFTR